MPHAESASKSSIVLTRRGLYNFIQIEFISTKKSLSIVLIEYNYCVTKVLKQQQLERFIYIDKKTTSTLY